MHRFEYRTAPQVDTFHNACISAPFKEKLEEKRYLLSGCVYDDRGHKIPCSERRGGTGGDVLIDLNPWHASFDQRTCPYIRGRHLFIGHLFSHYGHFITETLSPLWPLATGLLDGRDFDGFVAINPKIFDPNARSAFQVAAWEALGVDPDKIYLVSEATRVEQLTVPERAIAINAGFYPELRSVYSKIRKAYGRENDGGLYYLSRKNQTLRSVSFEPEIENLFRKHDFEIIMMESLSFQQQVALVSSAQCVAGFSGSALHNILFASEGCRLIELGDERSRAKPLRMQEICNEIAKADPVFVPYIDQHQHEEKRVSSESYNRHSLSSVFKFLKRQPFATEPSPVNQYIDRMESVLASTMFNY